MEMLILILLVVLSTVYAEPTDGPVKTESEEDYAQRTIPGNKTGIVEPYEEYEEDYYDGTFREYPCADRSPRSNCIERVPIKP
jgi:hypothetical protein